MYAGAHGLANGLDSILDAAALIEDMGFADKVQFCFIGDGPEKTRLQERARNEGLNTIQFESYVPRKEIYGLLQEADAFVITLKDAALFRRYGVSPNKLFDYLSSGRPVIFGIDALNNPVKESSCGLAVSPEDPEAIARAVVQLLEMSEKERWEMGLRGRRYVEEFHDYCRLADKIETVLLEVTKSSD
jgi:glycosyltransferase involved in cell wall biosynthesis